MIATYLKEHPYYFTKNKHLFYYNIITLQIYVLLYQNMAFYLKPCTVCILFYIYCTCIYNALYIKVIETNFTEK